jgi:hypothetical protein
MADAIQAIADWLFRPYVIAVLLGGGLFLSIRTGFVQVRRFGDGLRAMLAPQEKGAKGALTPFQSFMTALAASIGTGNIAGVATAIVSGGPGALFWIWVYGFVATSIKFAEAVLGMKYRVVRGEVRVGPDVLPPRRHEVAGARLDLRRRCRHRRADDDAVYAAELDRRRDELCVSERHRESAVARRRAADRALRRPRGGRADVGRHHPRREVDRRRS